MPQQGSGAQQETGAEQHDDPWLRRKHFFSMPENRQQRGLLQGSQYVTGSQNVGAQHVCTGAQQVGAGAQHVGSGAQHGSGCGQHGSQHDIFVLKQPNRPASAD